MSAAVERPDFRTRRIDVGWVVDAWAGIGGWEQIPGVWASKTEAIASTDPSAAFCYGHWSWLCKTNHVPSSAGGSTGAISISGATPFAAGGTSGSRGAPTLGCRDAKTKS